MRLLIQGVGTRIRTQFDVLLDDLENRSGKLVFIAEKGKVTKETIEKYLLGWKKMHILFREQHGLEENEVPIDLDQKPSDLSFLSFSDSDLSGFAEGWIRGK